MAHPALHIPHKEWASGFDADLERPDAASLARYQMNLWAVMRWARTINCDGDGGSYTQADWTRIPWRPAFEDWTPSHTKVTYCRLEDWSAQVCRPLHIPYKEWGEDVTRVAEFEAANWLAVERWASTIGACCTGSSSTT